MEEQREKSNQRVKQWRVENRGKYLAQKRKEKMSNTCTAGGTTPKEPQGDASALPKENIRGGEETRNAQAAQRLRGRLHQHWSSSCRAKKKTKNGDREKRHEREEKRGQKASGSTKIERETNARKGEESKREQGERGDSRGQREDNRIEELLCVCGI